ncbi:MAG: aminotransferase class V-fold PLP-dependent enzyme [Proteobacteria bacterium]|nr:aminotransferase class V-fold PLP-dependent enzyme [Pseudomonadota bacterium]
MPTLPCQRALFDLPDDVAYFRCAASAPLPHRSRLAGERALSWKLRPWGPQWNEQSVAAVERARGLFAGLIGATADDIALIPSASYGLSTAANNLRVGEGRNVVILADQFPSNVYPWREALRRDGGELRTVVPQQGQWTPSVVAAIDTNTAIVAIPHCHWLNGAMLDLGTISARCRATNTALVLDLSQSAGVVSFSVGDVDPDFAVSVAEKWLLGPVQLAFLYVAPRHQQGRPIEHGWVGRAIDDARHLHSYTDSYRSGARRFDAGERTNIINLSIAIESIVQIVEWGMGAIAPAIAELTEQIASRAAALGYPVDPGEFRAPHIIGLRHPKEWPNDIQARLEADKVMVSLRGGVLRVAPHVYNQERDVDALINALADQIL